MNLREEARGRPCMVRLPGICQDAAPAHIHTVLTHYRLATLSGGQLKPHDLIGAHGCDACHGAVDRRTHRKLDYDFVRLAHAEAVMRTIDALLRDGYEFTKRKV